MRIYIFRLWGDMIFSGYGINLRVIFFKMEDLIGCKIIFFCFVIVDCNDLLNNLIFNKRINR